MRSARLSLIALAMTLIACHRHRVSDDVVQPPPSNGNRRVESAPSDPTIAALFTDTTYSSAFVAQSRDYNVQNAAERQALQATLTREHAMWESARPRAYRFLLRTDCFCPGPRGWLLVEVRPNQQLLAWDRTGRSVNPREWTTFSIDYLYGNLENLNNQQSHVLVSFDERWHFPRYVHTSMIFPDGWSITQIRGFQPL